MKQFKMSPNITLRRVYASKITYTHHGIYKITEKKSSRQDESEISYSEHMER